MIKPCARYQQSPEINSVNHTQNTNIKICQTEADAVRSAGAGPIGAESMLEYLWSADAVCCRNELQTIRNAEPMTTLVYTVVAQPMRKSRCCAGFM